MFTVQTVNIAIQLSLYLINGGVNVLLITGGFKIVCFQKKIEFQTKKRQLHRIIIMLQFYNFKFDKTYQALNN